MAQTVSNLPVSAKISYPGASYQGMPIVWLKADENHAGYPADSVTLVSEGVLGHRAIDASELGWEDQYGLGGQGRALYGNARYAVSNKDQWLNKEGLPWFVPQHSRDRQPSSGLVSSNPYENEPGFLTGFAPEFKAVMLPTVLKCRKPVIDNPSSWGETIETITRLVFLLSTDEAGIQIYGKVSGLEGTRLALFLGGISNDSSRALGVPWRLRSPKYMYLSSEFEAAYDSNHVRADGSVNSGPANNGDIGDRPALNIRNDTLVSDTPDANGVYTIIFNDPPTTPPGITVPPSATVNSNIAISWQASTDPEGDPITYELERSVNGGASAALTTTPGLTYSHAVDGSMGTLQYRVRATDATGASGWATSSIVPVVNNEAPVISGVDTDLGVLTSPPTFSFTVTDDTPGSGVSLDAYLDGANILHEDVIELGQQIDITLTQLEFFSLMEGSHALIVTATDGLGQSASRIFSFSRVKAPIDFKLDPIPTSGRSTRIQTFVRHNAPNLILEACNNALDDDPAWEAISPDEWHTFENTASDSGQWAIGVKAYAAATTDVPFVYIDRLGGGFMMFGTGGGGESLAGVFLALQSRVDGIENQIEELQGQLAGAATAWNGGG